MEFAQTDVLILQLSPIEEQILNHVGAIQRKETPQNTHIIHPFYTESVTD